MNERDRVKSNTHLKYIKHHGSEYHPDVAVMVVYKKLMIKISCSISAILAQQKATSGVAKCYILNHCMLNEKSGYTAEGYVSFLQSNIRLN